MSYDATLKIAGHMLYKDMDVDNPTIFSIFTEKDKVSRLRQMTNEDGDVYEQPEVKYQAASNVVKDRLEFMGFTLGEVKKIFNKEKKLQLERMMDMQNNYGRTGRNYGRDFRLSKRIIREMTFDRWQNALQFIIENGLDRNNTYHNWYEENAHPLLPIDVKFLLGAGSYGTLWCPFFDLRPYLRALIDFFNANDLVIFDISEYIEGEDIEIDFNWSEWSEREMADDYITKQKVIILTEGSSDKWMIESSLKILYPHLSEYYSFMDYETSRAAGGASAVVSAIKSFIGAGIVNRTIALFDNDTAAKSALRGLSKIKIPSNFKILTYPDIRNANKYPTLGPQGIISMNVNGLACSIEMYLGKDVLRQENGRRMPVLWKGYDEVLARYHGELKNKSELQNKFRMKIDDCISHPSRISRYDWTDMKSVIDQILHAFNK